MRRDLSEGLAPAIDSFMSIAGVNMLRVSIFSVARSLNSDSKFELNSKTLAEEMRVISSRVKSGKKKIQFWFPCYDRVERMSKGVCFRVPKKGSKRSASKALENDTIWEVYNKDLGKTIIRGFFSGDNSETAAYIVSSMIDLADLDKDQSILIDTFNGTIRKHDLWWEKLTPLSKSASLSLIPFNKITLSIFGDRHVVKPYSATIRRQVCEIAENSGWNSETTLTRVKRGLKNSDIKAIPELLL